MILILGASSYVGARIYFDLLGKYELTGTYHGNKLSEKFLKLDITDSQQVQDLISRINPEVIIHVANEANPRWCEAHPDDAIKINQTSTKNIVDASQSSKLIYISSTVASNPFNVYAKTKFESENYIKANHNNWVILRPSLVIGVSPNFKNDRMMNRLIKDLDSNTPNQYDTTWKFKPTDLNHLSEICEHVINRNLSSETIDVVIDHESSRYSLADEILSPLGIKSNSIANEDTTPSLTENINDLVRLNLPTREYSTTIKTIILDIQNRQKFRI